MVLMRRTRVPNTTNHITTTQRLLRGSSLLVIQSNFLEVITGIRHEAASFGKWR